ncbi:hypothetical protein [[Ruminococcus] torques]|uniref:hypothetical protein n=1 Tax=[Ruminococcus] torques TaxID=33039 RepID=UPI0025A41836|nr:hypothetical protein [[Ruminococcus] torques]MDM8236060.1 hypothetical protein [[Ruminococcus] torques]
MKTISKVLSLIAAGVFLLSGCGNEGASGGEIMTAKEFKTAMEEKGLSVTDQTDSAADSSYQQIYVAVDEEKYSFEYYFMRDPGAAENVFDYAKDNLTETYAEDESAKTEEHGSGDVKEYSVSASDYYCELIQRENAVLYVTAYADYKDEAEAIIEELEY